MTFGPIVLITLGVLFLVAELYPRLDFGRTFPVLMIVMGVVMLMRYNASTEGHIPRPQVIGAASQYSQFRAPVETGKEPAASEVKHG